MSNEKTTTEKIAIIGLGYVGLPLAIEFGKKYPTIGFDINETRIRELKNGYDRTLEVTEEKLHPEHLQYTNHSRDIQDATVYIITVPTPIDKRNQPDLSDIIASTEMIAKMLSPGDLVIYESTVYPGVTNEICAPLLEKHSGMKLNEDFYCGYSPERINPGDKERTLTTIQKITSGSSEAAAQRVDRLYQSIITAGTHLVSSIRVAEAVKVIENTQRDVNIALINELAMIFDTIGIDTKEVIEGAATKWNFIKLYPGLVGGHCIGVDPYYLTFKALENGYEPNLILAARQINTSMGRYVAQKTIKLVNSQNKKVFGAKVLVLGLSFKENCPDIRNTKVVDLIQELEDYHCDVDVYDPWIDPKEEKKHFKKDLIANPFENDVKYDAIVVCVAHKQFVDLSYEQFSKISAGEPVIVDVKGLYAFSSWRL